MARKKKIEEVDILECLGEKRSRVFNFNNQSSNASRQQQTVRCVSKLACDSSLLMAPKLQEMPSNNSPS